MNNTVLKGIDMHLMEKATLTWLAPDVLKPYEKNARTHTHQQVAQLAASIERFGFTNPVLISAEMQIVAGHARLEAARLLGLEKVPCLALSGLSRDELRAYVLADNKLALNAGWDKALLAGELQALIDVEFDLSVTGFSLAEIDLVLDEARDSLPDAKDEPEDQLPGLNCEAVVQTGEVWELGRHRLLCGDARQAGSYEELLAGETVDLIVTDPPYNVPIDGHVCGSGRVRHREFAFASGEMSRAEFTTFLRQTLGCMFLSENRFPLLGDMLMRGEACRVQARGCRVRRRAAGWRCRVWLRTGFG